MSIPACHVGHPCSILGNGVKGRANAMEFTRALPRTIPHSHMPNFLFVARDNSFEPLLRTFGRVRGRGHMTVVSSDCTTSYCHPYVDEFPLALVMTVGHVFEIRHVLPIRSTVDTSDTRLSL